MDVADGRSVDDIFSAFAYEPSNPFPIDKTVQSQPRQPLPMTRMDVADGRSVDDIFSAFAYEPSNPFPIDKTVQSQPRQPLPMTRMDVADGRSVDDIFSAFAYEPSNPFPIDKTAQSQPRQPLPMTRMDVADGRSVDDIFSAFAYEPSNPFPIDKTAQSQPRQPLPTPVRPPHNASSWKRPGRGLWRREIPSKDPSPCARNRTSTMLEASSSSSTAPPGGGKPVVVSRFFLPSHASSSLLTDAKSQPRQPLPTPVPPRHNASSWKRPGRGLWRREIPSKNPSPCARNRTSTMLEASSSSSTAPPGGGKPVVVSRFFLPSHASSSLLTDAKSQPRQPLPTPVPPRHNASSWKRPGRGLWRREIPSKNPSPCARNRTSTMLEASSSSSTAPPGGGKPVVVSRFFLPSHASSSLLTDAKSSRSREPHAKAIGSQKLAAKRKSDCAGLNSNEQPRKQRAKKEPVAYFSPAEKKSEFYLRVADNNPWDPPISRHNLLQERHSFDPWRVLIICMLLNVTTGIQVGRVLPSLFLLCPNAEVMSKVDEEEVENVIRSLGLQKKRAKMLKRFSCEYLRNDWVYVTQLHGIGKYAADAYAIFCAGKIKQVNPRDHKLVDYWKFCEKKLYFES